MGAISDAANAAFRDFAVDGNPASGAYQPPKPDIRAIFATVDATVSTILSAQIGGGVVQTSLAALLGNLAFVDGTPGAVYGDPAPANNGVYRKSGAAGSGSWSRVANLPVGIEGPPGAPSQVPGPGGLDGAPGPEGDPGGISTAFKPGDYPSNFTAQLTGSKTAAAQLDPSLCLPSAIGLVYRVTGAAIVATRAAVWLEPNAFYAVRLNYTRLSDPSDPNNDAVQAGIQWLDANYGALSQTIIKQVSTSTASAGRQIVTARVPSLRGDLPAITPPAGAVYWRPFIRTFGADGVTAIESLVTSDVTNAGVYAPDISDLSARLAAFESVVANGQPLSTPILPSYTVSLLPRPGTRGRKAFATDGRAPNAAGVLEAANAGTGVEVTDNGTAWKISGTNQTVQS